MWSFHTGCVRSILLLAKSVKELSAGCMPVILALGRWKPQEFKEPQSSRSCQLHKFQVNLDHTWNPKLTPIYTHKVNVNVYR